MSNFVILKWLRFEFKAKFEKMTSLFRSKIGISDILFEKTAKRKF